MMKIKLILSVLAITVLYYFLVFYVFYDDQRWAREFMYMREMMNQSSGETLFSNREESFWDKYTRRLLTDFRKKPRGQGRKNQDPWWKPNFTKSDQMKVARFLDRFKGKGLWRKDMTAGSVRDSIAAFYEKIKLNDKKEFDKWLSGGGSNSSLSKDNALFYLIAGTEARRYHQYVLARKILTKGLELCEDDEIKEGIFQELGYVEHESGRWDKAQKWFEKALEMNPDHSGYYVNLGWNFFLKRNFKESLRLNKIALEMEEEKWIPLYNVAISYLAMNDFKKAYFYYRNLSEMKLGENSFYYILEDLFTLREMDRQNKGINFFIGYTYLAKKRFAKANEYFGLFLNDYSGVPMNIVNDARFYYEKTNQ